MKYQAIAALTAAMVCFSGSAEAKFPKFTLGKPATECAKSLPCTFGTPLVIERGWEHTKRGAFRFGQGVYRFTHAPKPQPFHPPRSGAGSTMPPRR
jgi:hypothetical protein